MSLKNIRRFESALCSPKSAGFYGWCSYCLPDRERTAEYMGQDIAGRWISLCRHHAARYLTARVAVSRADVAAAKAAIRGQT